MTHVGICLHGLMCLLAGSVLDWLLAFYFGLKQRCWNSKFPDGRDMGTVRKESTMIPRCQSQLLEQDFPSTDLGGRLIAKLNEDQDLYFTYIKCMNEM